jgi:D-lactate dehydrogenase (cytochrome)
MARDPVASLEPCLAALGRLLDGRLSAGEAIRRQHANALTWIPAELPDAVVWPSGTNEVAEIVRIAAAHRVAIVPFGAGTSLEGHVNAPCGGIALDLSRMDRILDVSPRDLDCTVEAGVSRGALNRHLRDTGLFFSVDPGAEDATLGGMAATRASGTNSVRYGTMRDNVIRCTAVMADGSVVRTGSKARKSAAGYDLTRLLIGSEGTLGIMTELTLRLYPVPEAMHAAVATFPSVQQACDAAIGALHAALAMARIELLDQAQIAAVNAYSRLDLDEAPALLFELHGTAAGAAADVAALQSIVREHGARSFEHAENTEERRRLWRARHDAFWAIKAAWPGKAALVTDVCVPLSRLAECVTETEADIRRSGLVAPLVGHVGDGNFHAIVMLDAASKDERGAVHAFVERLTDRALAMDGTCTGEHGIGQGKIAALERELGTGVEVLRRIKLALDPLGILNPGKMFR